MSVAVPLISFPDRVAVAFQVACLSTPWIESVPVRSNRQLPDSGRGLGSALTFVTVKVAVGKRAVSIVLRFTKLSRREVRRPVRELSSTTDGRAIRVAASTSSFAIIGRVAGVAQW